MLYVIRLAVAVVVAALVVGTVPVVAADDPIVIPAILSLTGPGAFLGNSTRRTLAALQAHVNASGGIRGRPIEFAITDDQTNPQVDVQLVTSMRAQAPVIIGFNLAGSCRAIMPLTVPNGPLAYCIAPTVTPAKDSYVFSASVSSFDDQVATLRYFRKNGWKRFAVLATTEASGQDAVEEINAALKTPELSDMTLVATERFEPAAVSATAQVSRIKSATPQALIVWTPGTPFGTALHALNDVGLDVPVTASGANMITAQLDQLAAYAPKNLTFASPAFAGGVAQDARVKKNQDEYLSVLHGAGIQSDLLSGMVWDPAHIVLAAYSAIGPKATSEQIHAYIESLRDFAGITGVYDFRDGSQRGINSSAIVMIRWRADKGYTNETGPGAR
jgi:branched-chain amino acid transport system substrate-binding protein